MIASDLDRECRAVVAFDRLCPPSFDPEQRERAYLVALRNVRNLTTSDPTTCVLVALDAEYSRETP